MSKYVDLILVKHQNPHTKRLYLYEAPPWSGISSGDQVLVEPQSGDEPVLVDVQNAYTIERDRGEYRFILSCTGATEPLKRVVAKLCYKIFDEKDYGDVK